MTPGQCRRYIARIAFCPSENGGQTSVSPGAVGGACSLCLSRTTWRCLRGGPIQCSHASGAQTRHRLKHMHAIQYSAEQRPGKGMQTSSASSTFSHMACTVAGPAPGRFELRASRTRYRLSYRLHPVNRAVPCWGTEILSTCTTPPQPNTYS